MQRIVVTGGGGFIGLHLVARLERDNPEAVVVVADIRQAPRKPATHNRVVYEHVDLRSLSACCSIIDGADAVFHLAADMGGMGFIGSSNGNDFGLGRNNLTMTINVLEAVRRCNAHRKGLVPVRFVYASSACVYPEHEQLDAMCAPLTEEMAESGPPDSFYGFEKLAGEKYVAAAHRGFGVDVRIARFHNVYGPLCTWHGGREKAPAALTRKVLALTKLAEMRPLDREQQRQTLALWGDGEQTRTFLFVDDAIEALVRLFQLELQQPGSDNEDAPTALPIVVNIGSDEVVAIKTLAETLLDLCNATNAELAFDTTDSALQGVRGRNCDRSRAEKMLGWAPTTSLREGLSCVVDFVREQMNSELDGVSSAVEREQLLRSYTGSHTAQCMQQGHGMELGDSARTFAILLPITSRGYSDAEAAKRQMTEFVEALLATTTSAGDPFAATMHVLLGLDDDDPVWGCNRQSCRTWLLGLFERADIQVSVHSMSEFEPGAVVSYWRALTRAALQQQGSFYFVLLGDDVRLCSTMWMRSVDRAFAELAETVGGVPHGFGCVALRDLAFPGFPTFPVFTRVHLEAMASDDDDDDDDDCGDPFPYDALVNQDADPLLFQLYRRWGASVLLDNVQLRNEIGGAQAARYQKRAAMGWTLGLLDDAVARVEAWLGASGLSPEQLVTLDVVVPTYRCDPIYIRRFLQLPIPSNCSTMVIIIIDRAASEVAEEIHDLIREHETRWWFRFRFQPGNTGASAARNRGLLQESAAEWVLFLDDDVIPDKGIVAAYVDAIAKHPESFGFVGPSTLSLPQQQQQQQPGVLALATMLSGCTFFWDAPKWIGHHAPWAVTANVLLRRRHASAYGGFSVEYPKTGGGEDIDCCIKTRKAAQRSSSSSKEPGLRCVPNATVEHPFWDDGAPNPMRFARWAFGDGLLIYHHPENCFRVPPNASECIVLLLPLLMLWFAGDWGFALRGWLAAAGMIVLASMAEDAYHMFGENSNRLGEDTRDRVGVCTLAVAAAAAGIFAIMSETGRLVGHARRGHWRSLLRRFDWFVGTDAAVVAGERRRALRRFCLFVAVVGVAVAVVTAA